jgi:hypothetical protein
VNRSGDPGAVVLRDTEHFLFRYLVSSKLNEGVEIPDGLPWEPPGPDNPTIRVDEFFMHEIHDPIYNPAREVGESLGVRLTPSTPDMYEWEGRGYDYGYCAAGECGRGSRGIMAITPVLY